MSINLQRIEVKGLFDTFELDVPIKDNTLILVGENGSGKSTLINIIYYVLTAQWDRLSELPFKSCIVTLNNEKYDLVANLPLDLKMFENDRDFLSLKNILPADDLNIFLELLAKHSLEYWASDKGLEKLKKKIIYTPYVKSSDRKKNFLIYQKLRNLIKNQHLLSNNDKSDTDKLAQELNSNTEEQILFLPTYRRIEKELSDVFPQLNIEESSPDFIDDQEVEQQSSYIELVEFGMTDVAKLFKSTLKDLDQNFRSDLNKFTGSYLHQILQESYKNINISSLKSDEVASTVDLMLSRIGKDILSEDDQKKLRSLLDEVKSDQKLEGEQLISAHFLISLVEIHKKQQEREMPVKNLVDLVNEYLSNKIFYFDPTAFELTISRKDTSNKSQVPLHGLSSGEKQIVSLFSHIFLSDYKSYFVVIDEPELSISVPWQRRFLEDLKKTNKCSGLIAVTHSPFVFDNSLEKYAHSISEFVKES